MYEQVPRLIVCQPDEDCDRRPQGRACATMPCLPAAREDLLSAAETTPDGLSPEAETARQRRVRTAWLADLARSARGRQRLAALCISLSGALLIGQAAAIAWLRWAAPLASGLPVLAGLAVILVLRTLLGATEAAAGDVADAARLAARTRVRAPAEPGPAGCGTRR